MTFCIIGSTELFLICFVALLLFGGKKLPELMKGIGKGVKSFKDGLSEPSGNNLTDSSITDTDGAENEK